MFETTGIDMKSGPVTSSSVGRLIACTCPQKCPLSSPRSRYQRPPGRASSTMGIGTPATPVLPGPICSRSASKVASRDARTWISSWRSSVRLSSVGAVRATVSPPLCLWVSFGALLHARQLVTPVLLEDACPFVKGTNGVRVRAVEHLPAIAPDVDESDMPQHLEVLRHGRLTDSEPRDDVADVTLARRQVDEDVAALRFSDGVEDVGGRRGARHEREYIFPLRNMSSPGCQDPETGVHLPRICFE